MTQQVIDNPTNPQRTLSHSEMMEKIHGPGWEKKETAATEVRVHDKLHGPPMSTVQEIPSEIRTFSTGATRDQDTTKYDPEGFLCPLVIERYNEFMHSNRKQKDGNIRDSDNWQKGIPKAVYMKSLWRHFHDVWLHHRGYAIKTKEPLEVALCAVLFNTMGLLHELLKEKVKQIAGQG